MQLLQIRNYCQLLMIAMYLLPMSIYVIHKEKKQTLSIILCSIKQIIVVFRSILFGKWMVFSYEYLKLSVLVLFSLAFFYKV